MKKLIIAVFSCLSLFSMMLFASTANAANATSFVASDGKTYNKITLASDLGEGQYIIGCELTSEVVFLGAEAGSSPSTYFTKVSSNNALVFNFVASGSSYAIQENTSKEYLFKSGTKNYAGLQNVDDQKYTIETGSNGNWSISTMVDTTKWYLLYNDSSSARFSHYKASSNSLLYVSLYKEASAPVAATPQGNFVGEKTGSSLSFHYNYNGGKYTTNYDGYTVTNDRFYVNDENIANYMGLPSTISVENTNNASASENNYFYKKSNYQLWGQSYITVTCEEKINTLLVNRNTSSNGTLEVLVNGMPITGSNSLFTINSNTLTIKNSNTSEATYERIDSLVIDTLVANYSDTKIRFGAKMSENSFDEDATYGVILVNQSSFAGKDFATLLAASNTTSASGFKDYLVSQSVKAMVVDCTANMKKVNASGAIDKAGKFYQFAAVMDVSSLLDLEVNAVCYMELEGQIYLMEALTSAYSAKSLANKYITDNSISSSMTDYDAIINVLNQIAAN